MPPRHQRRVKAILAAQSPPISPRRRSIAAIPDQCGDQKCQQERQPEGDEISRVHAIFPWLIRETCRLGRAWTGHSASVLSGLLVPDAVFLGPLRPPGGAAAISRPDFKDAKDRAGQEDDDRHRDESDREIFSRECRQNGQAGSFGAWMGADRFPAPDRLLFGRVIGIDTMNCPKPRTGNAFDDIFFASANQVRRTPLVVDDGRLFRDRFRPRRIAEITG